MQRAAKSRCKVTVEDMSKMSMSKKMFRHVLGGAANAADAAHAALCTLTVENLLSTVMSNMSKLHSKLLSKVIFRQYILVKRKMQGWVIYDTNDL